MTHRTLASFVILSVQFFSAAAGAGAAPGQSYYLRHPTGHGDTLVFQFRDKLWRHDKGTPSASPLASTDAEAA